MKFIEVKKEDLKYNLDIIKDVLRNNASEKKVEIIAVVKANGMGLGLANYSKFLVSNGIKKLAVSTVEEAINLRKAGIEEEILLMSPTCEKEELKQLIENDITLTVGSLKEKEVLEETISDSEKTVKVHIKIDTGFARYGFLYNDFDNIKAVYNMPEQIKIAGIFTHFSKPIDEKWTNIQFERFQNVISYLKDNNIDVGITHCASSTAFIKYPNMYLDAIRVGSVIQGRVLDNRYGFKKVGTLKTNVAEIKVLPKGYNISYTNTYKTKRETKIAVIPVGYYDGFNKDKLRDNFSFKNNIVSVLFEIRKIFKDNSLKVKINDKQYKVIGRLGMYHAIVDITGSENIDVGTEVDINISPLQANEEIRREYL